MSLSDRVVVLDRGKKIADLGDAKKQCAFGVLRVSGANADKTGGFAVGFLSFALIILAGAALLASFGDVFLKRIHIKVRQSLERGFVLEFGVFGVNGLRQGDQVIRVSERNVDTDCFTGHSFNEFDC